MRLWVAYRLRVVAHMLLLVREYLFSQELFPTVLCVTLDEILRELL